MYDFWLRAANGEGIAPWSSFDPVDHSRVLPWIMLLRAERRDGQEIFRYVVCGTGCSAIFGFSYQNKVFGENLPPEAVRRRTAEFERAREGQGPILSRTELPIEGREHVLVYRGVFAFSADGSWVDRIMVVLAPHDELI